MARTKAGNPPASRRHFLVFGLLAVWMLFAYNVIQWRKMKEAPETGPLGEPVAHRVLVAGTASGL